MKDFFSVGSPLILALVIVLCAGSPARAADPLATTTNQPGATPAVTNLSRTPRVLTFGELAGYELKLTEEMILNTNRVTWADSQVLAMIPEAIRKLDGQRVLVEGFMYPVAYEHDQLTEFMLVRDMPSCCFGFPPNPHEWVGAAVVKTAKIKAEVYRPVRVGGIFHVGPQRQGGYLSSIYRLEADKLEETPY
jgi:hypothetical protein